MAFIIAHADVGLGNPKSCEWGNISWGHATSKDIVHWQLSSESTPALSTGDSYDKDGVFTGCMVSQGIKGEKGHMSLIYSSVRHLPIHWTIPYVRGCEGLAIATSKDGGKSWNKLGINPILEEEPEGLDVTGFRDPYVASWPAIDAALGVNRPAALYGVVSGGIRGEGPAVFLYEVCPDDLTKFMYLGLLFKSAINLRRSPKWSGDFGVNWECAGFMTLKSNDESSTMDFLIMGSEGGNERPWVTSFLSRQKESLPRRTTRYCFWVSGSLDIRGDAQPGVEVEGERISFTHEMDGILDHGCFYAANSFFDPVMDRRVLWGWLPEEDVPLEHCTAKGWNGSLALPRELFIQRMTGVVGSIESELSTIGSIKATKETDSDTFLVETLGIRPLPELASLRSAECRVLKEVALPMPTTQKTDHLAPITGKRWELQATIAISYGCASVGILAKHNRDKSVQTTIAFLPDKEELVVDRRYSNTDENVNKSDDRGPLTLFRVKEGDREVQEMLKLHIFVDHDILEVYANERFVLSTMVYTSDPEAELVSLFAEGKEGSATFKDVKFWICSGSIFDRAA